MCTYDRRTDVRYCVEPRKERGGRRIRREKRSVSKRLGRYPAQIGILEFASSAPRTSSSSRGGRPGGGGLEERVMPTRIKRRALCECDGTALLVVLIVLLAIAAWSSSFVWLMNQQLTRAGARYRSAAALAVADAGVHRALSILEGEAPDAPVPGRTWRTEEYAETIHVGSFEGQFTLALVDDLDGAVVVTSAGEVGGIVRRLRARVYVDSPARLAALYGASVVRLEQPPAPAARECLCGFPCAPCGPVTEDPRPLRAPARGHGHSSLRRRRRPVDSGRGRPRALARRTRRGH